ncbi:MAG TPA: multicopper oxidase domain-containing protein [Micromonospora sp.]
MITHLHGGHTPEESDGYPEAWFLPDARDIPDGYAQVGSYYDEFREKFEHRYGVRWQPGSATFQYENEQRATALWYHDHSHGITRLGVYAGPIGYYLLRGGPSDLPPGVLPDAGRYHGSGDHRHQPPPHEIPLVIQDRSFLADGSLFYPRRATPTDPQAGPLYPDSDVPPIWIPGFHGTAMMVNGRTWPVLRVEPRRYRFRLLNACNHRHLILRIAAHPTARPTPTALSIWQIGNDGGFLPRPVQHEELHLSTAERADVIVDFGGLPEGTELYLVNEAPDDRYAGGRPGVDFNPANPDGSGQVLKFVVGPLVSRDTSVPPEQLRLPTIRPLGAARKVRKLALTEVYSTIAPKADIVLARLGQLDETGTAQPRGWHDPVSERVELGATEIWEFHNFTGHAHPIHLHQVQFEVVGRGRDGRSAPDAHEAGFKDVVVALPGHITRVKARFTLPGRYVWHCHLLEHEDNDMMLPYVVGGRTRDTADTGDGYGTRSASAATAAGLLTVAAASGVLLTRDK